MDTIAAEEHVLTRELRHTLRVDALRLRRERASGPSSIIQSLAIQKSVIGLEQWKRCHFPLLYVATNDEISTKLLMEAAFSEGKRVLVPKCVSSTTFVAVEISHYTDLVEGTYGILEPKESLLTGFIETKLVPDCVITPGVLFDRQGNRIGMGGGFYDRYFQWLQNETSRAYISIGLCSSGQLAKETIVTEPWDIAVDIVVTENEVVHCD